MKSVYDVLDPIVNASISQKEKGTKYEAACVWYLKNDPYWKSKFSRVGTLEEACGWDDSPVRDTRDIGVDLVAQESGTGLWWAIQCKCWSGEKNLTKAECDSFLARAGTIAVDGLMIMTTAKGLAANLQKEIEDARVQKKAGAQVVDTAKMAASDLDWQPFLDGAAASGRETFDLRDHQRKAVDSIKAAWKDHDRCKAIMACGTGKTLMALRLAEEWCAEHVEGRGGIVLFCAPSISLVGQSMREWLRQARTPLSALVVCSDSKASRRDDSVPQSLADFEYPATTRPDRLCAAYEASRRANPDGLVAVFSTYQSVEVLHEAQQMGFPDFDLAVCDEAHRTTGATLPGTTRAEASAFTKIHSDENVCCTKRLYMTATPRIYGQKAKDDATEQDITLSSMDDEKVYGPVAYQLKFGEAVDKGLLCDYKVVVLSVEEDALGARARSRAHKSGALEYGVAGFGDDADQRSGDAGVGMGLDASDVAKIIGCWKGLADHGAAAPRTEDGLSDMLLVDDVNSEPCPVGVEPLHRAVGFCSTINSSKLICEAFKQVVSEYRTETGDDYGLDCELDHVDGTMPSTDRSRKLAWLAGDPGEGACRILTNARCLAEGIDVPNLDAVIFFNAKNSVVDIVQAVGRVMRKAPGKEYGYIILPIFVPSGMAPEEALDDNEVFANVWNVLQALRSHDERIEARIQALALEERAGKGKRGEGKGTIRAGGEEPLGLAEGVQLRLSRFPVESWEAAICTKLVKKCGTRIYWDQWTDDVARIAQRHIERIGRLVEEDEEVKESFGKFLTGLRDSLNPGISEQDAVEMVAQHVITVPVFEALFGDSDFAASNPVSRSIDGFLAALKGKGIEEDSDREVLKDVYASVRLRASMVRSDAARQQLIRDLYEGFFSKAFKGTSEKLGIVYTPGEVIEYILHETDRTLRREFGRGISDEGVHVLDPFAGTGSFMAQLIEGDLIPDADLPRKYRSELHSNEILLLAYYIMTVNIEEAYHARMGGDYEPFEGAVLTDTFQMTEGSDRLDVEMFVDNSERMLRENETLIQVIVGNPPYSVGQRSANDDNQNEAYPTLDRRIADTYAARTDATLKNSLYDSYIRAFRWASDRIGDAGVVCFVSNAGWIRGAAMDGMRKCLAEEFSEVRVFDLRGNARTSGEERRRERDNVFGQGTRTPIAVTMLVKNPARAGQGCRILYHDVGDYLTREEKLAALREATEHPEAVAWEEIEPDAHGDWLDQRDEAFEDFAPLGLEPKYREPEGVFSMWSAGVKTQRDPWAWNYSRDAVAANMSRLVDNTNAEAAAARAEGRGLEYDAERFSWTDRMKGYAEKGTALDYDEARVVPGMYRPFCRQWIYYDRGLNDRISQQPKLFPLALAADGVPGVNMAICTSGTSAFITDMLPDLHFVGDAQCFPLYWYEEVEADEGALPGLGGEAGLTRHDAITDEALGVFRRAYPRAFAGRAPAEGGEELTKLDLFHYVYGVLHSPEYRGRFAANLKKELPRIPLCGDFRAFSEAGRALADLHLRYEEAEPWPSIEEEGDSADPGRTEKITFGKCRRDDAHPKGEDRTVLHVAERMTLTGIPERAYAYEVNGKSAVDWIMDRYQVRTDKATGIVNDPNLYSDDPRYIVELVEKVVTVSMRTLDVVESLPSLDERPQPEDWPQAWKLG